MSPNEAENADSADRTRRRLLTGGAVLLGAAVVGTEGTAHAANGSAVLAGRTSNVASVETRLTNTGTTAGLNAVSTNTGAGARALGAIANGGYGAYIESATNHGASIWSKHKDKWGVFAINGGANATGGAVRADGRQNTGVFATTSNSKAVAVRADNATTVDNGYRSSAVIGTSGPGAAAQVNSVQDQYGSAAGAFGGYNGVTGIATGGDGTGVLGIAKERWGVGVHAVTEDLDSFPLVVQGPGTSWIHTDLVVTGTFTQPGGLFQIDHPQDPEKKYLSHAYVGSSEHKDLYDGVVTTDANGEATVTMPAWFEALNKDFRYQLTPIGSAAPSLHVKQKLSNRSFKIAGANPGQEVSWLLTGIRHDSWAATYPVEVERPKPIEEHGTYLHPEGFGKPASAGLFARLWDALDRRRRRRAGR